mmetsp:Transcript_120615/g.336567  ORF Transcript_120615/g.336567 Transcript_120615/m.336567 type:complete len:96 (-) Transcript_120615:817-1104(-)
MPLPAQPVHPASAGARGAHGDVHTAHTRQSAKGMGHPEGTSEYFITSLRSGSVGWLVQGFPSFPAGPLSSSVLAGATFFWWPRVEVPKLNEGEEL